MKNDALRLLAADLLGALGLFTRLPLERLARFAGPVRLGRSIWLWPTLGALIGACMGLVTWVALAFGLSVWIAALLGLAAQLLLTGALHEDGLADTADGFGSGGTATRRLEIMRDSRIGTYGALALGLILALKIASVSALPPGRLIAALAVAGSVGRACMLIVLATSTPARPDGLAASLVRLPRGPLVVGLATPPLLGSCLPGSVLPGLIAAVMLCWIMRRATMRMIGGYTGDTLGAVACLGEVAALVSMTCFARP